MVVVTFNNSSNYIDWSYIAPEDGVVTINGVEKEIKKGDYILKMYTANRQGEQPIFILKDSELIDYIKDYNRVREEQNKSHSTGGICDNCESEVPTIQG